MRSIFSTGIRPAGESRGRAKWFGERKPSSGAKRPGMAPAWPHGPGERTGTACGECLPSSASPSLRTSQGSISHVHICSDFTGGGCCPHQAGPHFRHQLCVGGPQATPLLTSCLQTRSFSVTPSQPIIHWLTELGKALYLQLVFL